MANNLVPNYTATLATVTAAAATSQTSALTLPISDTYAITLSSAAGTGTSPTCDVVIQWTPDDGTTWVNAPLRFAQVTTSISVQTIAFRPSMAGEAAWQNAVAATGGALAKNFPISRKIRVLYTIGGTNPSFTFSVYIASLPRGAGFTI